MLNLGVVLVGAMGLFALILGLFPETSLAKRLRRICIEKPAELLLDLSARDVGRLFVVVMLVVMILAAGPEVRLLLVAVGDITLLIEVLVVLWMVGVVTPWRLVRRLGGSLVERVGVALASAMRDARSRGRRRKASAPPSGPRDPEPDRGPIFVPSFAPTFAGV